MPILTAHPARLLLSCVAASLFAVGSARAATLWDEGDDGDLSSINYSPNNAGGLGTGTFALPAPGGTGVGTLSGGGITDTVTGSSTNLEYDTFYFVVPTDAFISQFSLAYTHTGISGIQVFKKVGVQGGSGLDIYMPLTGYETELVLPAVGSPHVVLTGLGQGPGQYAVSLRDRAGNGNPFSYTLFLQAPEPASTMLLASGAALMVLRRRQRHN